MIGRVAKIVLAKIALLFIVSVVAHAVVYLAPGEPSEVDLTNPRMKPEDVALIGQGHEGQTHRANHQATLRRLDRADR